MEYIKHCNVPGHIDERRSSGKDCHLFGLEGRSVKRWMMRKAEKVDVCRMQK